MYAHTVYAQDQFRKPKYKWDVGVNVLGALPESSQHVLCNVGCLKTINFSPIVMCDAKMTSLCKQTTSLCKKTNLIQWRPHWYTYIGQVWRSECQSVMNRMPMCSLHNTHTHIQSMLTQTGGALTNEHTLLVAKQSQHSATLCVYKHRPTWQDLPSWTCATLLPNMRSTQHVQATALQLKA